MSPQARRGMRIFLALAGLMAADKLVGVVLALTSGLEPFRWWSWVWMPLFFLLCVAGLWLGNRGLLWMISVSCVALGGLRLCLGVAVLLGHAPAPLPAPSSYFPRAYYPPAVMAAISLFYVVAGLLLWLPSVRAFFVFQRTRRWEDEEEEGLQMGTGPEALEWLRANQNESALASNRFGPTSTAIRFIEELYAAGAPRVVISEETIVEEDDGGPYADAIVVTLPTDLEKNARVRQICAREIRREGFDPEEEMEQDHVFLWWD